MSSQAYHDASLLGLRLKCAVPSALIVFAVLLQGITFSFLDRQVRFDYPDLATAGKQLQTKPFAYFVQSQLRGDVLAA